MTIGRMSLAILLLLAANLARAAIVAPETVGVPAGAFVQGSDRAEREAAYRADERAYGHDVTRRDKWYEDEPRRRLELPAFRITKTAITNRQYGQFLAASGRAAPDVRHDSIPLKNKRGARKASKETLSAPLSSPKRCVWNPRSNRDATR